CGFNHLISCYIISVNFVNGFGLILYSISDFMSMIKKDKTIPNIFTFFIPFTTQLLGMLAPGRIF
ncbi:MAG TPA: hypothetical protein PKX05_05115, partial [bacterium]|nr:hypothetical protein [bacterium]